MAELTDCASSDNAEATVTVEPSRRSLYTPEQVDALGLIEIGEGFLVDPETGEVFENREQPFRVVDVGSAEWVLRRWQERESEIVKQYELYTAQCEPILAAIRAAVRERDYWQARYSPELEIFAAQQVELHNALLPEKKRVSNFKTAYGRLQFGRSGPTIDIPLETLPDAIRWCEQFVPDAVKKDILKTPLEPIRETLPPAYFSVLPGRRWFAVQTGIKVPDEAVALAKPKANGKRGMG